METQGSQVLPPISFTACHRPYPGSTASAYALCFLAVSGLLPYTRGSASIPTPSDSSPIRTLPAIPVRQNSRGCTIRFMLRPAVLASTPGWVRPAPILGTSRLGTLSGQVQPVCHHTNPPPAYTSKRTTDVTTSFEVVRYRSRDLALCILFPENGRNLLILVTSIPPLKRPEIILQHLSGLTA